jgi:hypothetical protein
MAIRTSLTSITATDTESMMWPPRVVLALAVVAVLTALLVGALVVLPRSRQLPRSPRARWLVIGGVVLLLVSLIGWTVVVWPAYWD